MNLIIALVISLLVNILLGWYLVRLLNKFMFISENLADLFLTLKSFEVFTRSLYSMEMFHGEPVIQDLIHRTQVVLEESERFRSIFEYTLDYELEEELDDITKTAEEETQ